MWYDPGTPALEDEVLGKLTLQAQARYLDRSTLGLLRRVYGADLEGMPAAFGYETDQAELFLKRLRELRTPAEREIILKRFGMITGEPAGVRELAAAYRLPESRIREMDIEFLRLRERFRIVREDRE